MAFQNHQWQWGMFIPNIMIFPLHKATSLFSPYTPLKKLKKQRIIQIAKGENCSSIPKQFSIYTPFAGTWIKYLNNVQQYFDVPFH